MSERNNVLLVVLDSVRARNTSLHGYDRETTPFLSSFADRSTVYTQARSPGIHSSASHVSMFTGQHVEEHGAIEHTTQIDLSRTVWHELETEFGYSTGLFTNNRIVSNATNLGEGFEYVHEPDYPLAERLENKIDGTILEQAYFRWYDAVSRLTSSDGGDDDSDSLSTRLSRGVGKLTGNSDSSGSESSGYKTLFGTAFTDAFLDWETRQEGPWAACINLMDAHSPYEPKPEFDRWAAEKHWRIQDEAKPSVWETLQGQGWDRVEALEHLYDGTIRQTDSIVRDLVSALEDRGLLSETLLCITSDHGEAFGERSRLNPDVRVRDHKWGIHEVLTHVPFLVSYPERQDGDVVDEVVSLTDTPALLRTAATDGNGHDQLTGDDAVLASTFRLPEEKRSKYGSVTDLDAYVGPWRAVYENHGDSVRKFARHGDHHVTIDIDQAGAATVVSRDEHDRVAEAFGRLADSDLVTQEKREIDDDLEQQLEDLGYIR